MTAIGFIVFIFVAAVMTVFLVTAALFPSKVRDEDARLSAWAGYWAGLVIAAGYCVYALSTAKRLRFDGLAVPSFNIWGLCVGLVVGFALLWVVRIVTKSRAVGLFTLLLTSTSTITLFAYLFQPNLRDVAMYFSLGSLFGVLLNVVLFPSVARQVLRQPAQRAQPHPWGTN